MKRSAMIGIRLSIISYLSLSITKIAIGLWAHSLGVVADGLNNISDLVVSIALLIGLKVADRPADRNHPFGHNRAEAIAILIAVSSMVFVSINIWLDVGKALFVEQTVPIHFMAFYISILSAVIMFCVSFFNLRLSKKTKSSALKAAALDNRSDAFVSLGAAAGILGSRWGFAWIDPFAAFLVGCLILRTAIQLGKPAVHALMDGFDQSRLSQIRKKIVEIEGILEIRELRARSHGKDVFVEVTIGVDPHLTVTESHQLTEKMEQELIGFQNIKKVHIHVEPTLKTFDSIDL